MAMRIVAESARLLGAPRLMPDRLDAYRRGALSRRFRHAVCRKAGRGRRARRGALDAECRRARPDGLFARQAGRAGARHGPAHDGGLSQARLRAELDLRALSGRAPAGLRHGRRLGRVQRGGVLQFGARRAHQPLWRFSRHRLRDFRPRTGLRPASPGKPPRNAGFRRFRPARFLPRLGDRLAGSGQPLWQRSRKRGRSRHRHRAKSGRGCAEGVRRGRCVVGSRRPVPHRRRHAGSARRRNRARRHRARNGHPGDASKWRPMRRRGFRPPARPRRSTRWRSAVRICRSPNSARWSG